MDEYFNNLFKDIDSNIILDSEQREAIVCGGNSIIIAGAGSGKTTTMAAKVKYLVDKCNVKEEEIIVISYTNKAVLELKERINDGFGINCKISTFHKFSLNILKRGRFNYHILSDAYDIVYNCILNNYKKMDESSLKDFCNYCCDFLKRFKNMDYGVIEIDNWLKCLKGKDLKFMLFFKDLYIFYCNYLLENNLIDFEDIINRSINVLDKISLNYKYLIVDEFQDISEQRFKLIYKINKLFKSNIVVVGDDFQAIFEFAGSNVNLFTSFADKLDNVKVLKITHTYRNSQELIDIAGSFVMKNSNQVKKSLVSSKRISNPIVVYYGIKRVLTLNKIINDIYNEFGLNKILLLGRYNFDIDVYIDNKYFRLENDKVVWNKNNDLDITFLTVHSAKGLGYDNVVIINGFNGEFGFPSMVKDDKVMSLVSIANEDFYLAEERRLFYVALTRTKNRVYIITKFFNVSIFVKELCKFKVVKVRLCFKKS